MFASYVVCGGAGTFRGRNAGVWPPLKAFDLDFSEMSSPSWSAPFVGPAPTVRCQALTQRTTRFANDERLGWSFWHFRHQAYVNGTPHKGYDILAKWGTQMKHGKPRSEPPFLAVRSGHSHDLFARTSPARIVSLLPFEPSLFLLLILE